jgi:hypothetical protein
MKYLLDPLLARQLNVTGQGKKRAFKDLQLFETLYGKYGTMFFSEF